MEWHGKEYPGRKKWERGKKKEKVRKDGREKRGRRRKEEEEERDGSHIYVKSKPHGA